MGTLAINWEAGLYSQKRRQTAALQKCRRADIFHGVRETENGFGETLCQLKQNLKRSTKA